MHLLVISPETDDPREISAVQGMFALGLERYHIRKPGWTSERVRDWLLAFTSQERAKMVVHQYSALVLACGLAGVHWRDDGEAPVYPAIEYGIRSRAAHELGTVRTALGQYDSVLLSPLFPSFSKPNYGSTRAWTDKQIGALFKKRTLEKRRTYVYALGGIDGSKIDVIRQLGFDGAAVLGAIWNAADPVNAFCGVQAACRGGLHGSLEVPLAESGSDQPRLVASSF